MNQGHPNPMEGIESSVKAALTRAYKEEAKSRMVRTADFVLPQGFKKPTKKRIAAILEPLEDETGENNVVAESEDDENSSETEELGKFISQMIIYKFFSTMVANCRK